MVYETHAACALLQELPSASPGAAALLFRPCPPPPPGQLVDNLYIPVRFAALPGGENYRINRILPTFGMMGKTERPGGENPDGQYTNTALPIRL